MRPNLGAMEPAAKQAQNGYHKKPSNFCPGIKNQKNRRTSEVSPQSKFALD
jgi:hypothetical protein